MRLSLTAIAAIVLSSLCGVAIAAPEEAGKTAGWRLAKEASPYLRQHADNPIEWFAWNEAAFEKARKENKPIFLSVGYSTCYWCHVMERESFENEEIAAYLNKHFISVKVDRERRPDVDATYMIATELISRGGGWPNSVFLTPDLKPFFAVTYQPPTEFKGLAEQIANTWKAEETALRADADRIAGLIGQISSRKQAAVEMTPKTLAQASLKILAQFDPFNGGIGTAPKFPREPVLDLLLHRAERDRDVIVFEAVELALDNIIRGGINDHLAGGFHRYATDNEWAVPHFEKMLYNQALIGKLLVRAHEFSGRADYASAARKTFDFVLRDMTTADGGFASAFDAETDGKEGLFYLWTKEEIDNALGAAEAEFAAKALGVTEEGNHEGRNTLRIVEPILELSASLGMDEASLTKKLDEVFAKLAKVRAKRPALKRDNKILADWNAAMIRTLAEASVALDEPRYLEAAKRAMSLLVDKLGAGTAEMTRVYFEKSASLPASLADHASVGIAAIALYDATRDAKWLDLAKKSAEIATERFKDADSGALYLTASATGFVRTKQYDDGDLPAANAMALELTSKLSRRDRDPKWRHAADQLVGALSGIAHRTPLAMASTLKAIDLHARGETGPRQHLGKGVVTVKAMPSGDGKTARVEIEIENGWHINAHKPTEDFLLATILELDGQTPRGLTFPEPKEQKLGFHDRPLLLYEGRISLPFDLPETSNGDGMPVPVSLRVQACSDKICLEPETAQLYLPARTGG